MISLPDDILYEVVEQLRYDDSDKGLFLKCGWTSFSSARFHLSSLSKTSWRMRGIAERVLYQDIHVDNVGWIPRNRRSWHNDKLHARPAGSLPLLIRTLIQRPCLTSLVRGVDLRWCEGQEAIAVQELSGFLQSCPRLERFRISDVDEELLGMLEGLQLGIVSFGTSCYSHHMERVVSCFPRLETLQLFLHGPPILFTTRLSTHSIRRMEFHLHVSLEKFEGTCQSVLALAGESVEELTIENGVRTKECPTLPFVAAASYRRLETLCVKEIDPFEEPSMLTCMGSLRHLHVKHCRVLPPNAFECIPESIVSMTFSVYGEGFLGSVVECIRRGKWRPKGIRVDRLGNILDLKELCMSENIRFEEEKSGRKLTMFQA